MLLSESQNVNKAIYGNTNNATLNKHVADDLMLSNL